VQSSDGLKVRVQLGEKLSSRKFIYVENHSVQSSAGLKQFSSELSEIIIHPVEGSATRIEPN